MYNEELIRPKEVDWNCWNHIVDGFFKVTATN